MINHVKKSSIASCFSPDEKHAYFVPKYQREYVWGRDNWDQLFTDIKESERGHFLGSMICVNKESDSTSGARLELIDGQQRITTITILLCAIYARLSDASGDDAMVERINLKNSILLKGSRTWRFTPSEQSSNKNDLQNLFSTLFDEIAEPKKIRHFGNRRIAAAYKHFSEFLSDMTDQEAHDFYENLKGAELVVIEVPSHSDAFVLFESINNRGIPLSPIDIIKNSLLAALEKNKYGIDRAFEEWAAIIDRLPKAADQDRFLRQFYNIYRYDPDIRGDTKPGRRATKSTLIRLYDDMVSRDAKGLFSALKSRSKLYADLIDPSRGHERWGEAAGKGLLDLERLGAAPSYGYLMWLSEAAAEQSWDDALCVAQASDYIARFFFWRNLTNNPSRQTLDTRFEEIAHAQNLAIEDGKIRNPAAAISDMLMRLRKIAPRKTEREEALKGDLYWENYDAARFLLCKLEEVNRTREKAVDLWSYSGTSKNPDFTVEHILPQKGKLSKTWIVMLENDDQDAETIREESTHKLGNLTLSAYNASLGKMDFDRKRDRTDKNGQVIGYKNGFWLNEDLKNRRQWTKSTIEARTEKLMKAALKSMSLRGPVA